MIPHRCSHTPHLAISLDWVISQAPPTAHHSRRLAISLPPVSGCHQGTPSNACLSHYCDVALLSLGWKPCASHLRLLCTSVFMTEDPYLGPLSGGGGGLGRSWPRRGIPVRVWVLSQSIGGALLCLVSELIPFPKSSQEPSQASTGVGVQSLGVRRGAQTEGPCSDSVL